MSEERTREAAPAAGDGPGAAAAPDAPQGEAALAPFERFALRTFRATNRHAKPLVTLYQHAIPAGVIAACTGRRVELTGLARLRALDPGRSILLCVNHRSFFDQFVVAERLVRLGLGMPTYFPVRAPFFYERPAGMAVNVALAGGAMYPPIFRDPAKAELNKRAVEELTTVLAQPRTMVGMHPEGARSKAESPYELLPAQPGVGKTWLGSRDTTQVLPAFITGLTNSVADELACNLGLRPHRRIVVVFGAPLREDLVEGLKADRPAHAKRAADRILDAVRGLFAEEQAVRAGAQEPDAIGWPDREACALVHGPWRP